MALLTRKGSLSVPCCNDANVVTILDPAWLTGCGCGEGGEGFKIEPARNTGSIKQKASREKDLQQKADVTTLDAAGVVAPEPAPSRLARVVSACSLAMIAVGFAASFAWTGALVWLAISLIF